MTSTIRLPLQHRWRETILSLAPVPPLLRVRNPIASASQGSRPSLGLPHTALPVGMCLTSQCISGPCSVVACSLTAYQ